MYLRTTGGYFIGYAEKSKGYRFYCPNHNTRIIESGNARFIENVDISGSKRIRDVCIQEVRVEIPLPKTSNVVVHDIIVQTNNNQEQQINNQTLHNENVNIEPTVVEPLEIALRRSQRKMRLPISNVYMVYSQELEINLEIGNDPSLFSEAMECDDSIEWFNVIKEEVKSMDQIKSRILLNCLKDAKRSV